MSPPAESNRYVELAQIHIEALKAGRGKFGPQGQYLADRVTKGELSLGDLRIEAAVILADPDARDTLVAEFQSRHARAFERRAAEGTVDADLEFQINGGIESAKARLLMTLPLDQLGQL